MRIRFWGVRGSIAAPGPSTARYGGNTSCVQVEAGGTQLILDAGTGLRPLGDTLANPMGSPEEHVILLSHLHWDHIQGLPFFAPLYQPTRRVRIHGPRVKQGSLAKMLKRQMHPPGFPLRFVEVAQRVELIELGDFETFSIGAVRISTAALNHPGGARGYRLEHDGISVVYATDTEHYSCPDPRLIKLAEGADVLIYDAMYLPEEYRGDAGPARVGWGHSTFEAGAAVARAARVGRIVLFHHDPRRTDDALDALVDRARQRFEAVSAAREGESLELGRTSRAA